jgi:hypothetical protein
MTFITEASGFDETSGKSVFVHRELQESSFALHMVSKDRPRVGPMIVRMSFLLTSIDTHFEVVRLLCQKQLKDALAGGGKPPASPAEYIGCAGRDTYPIFAELNAFLFAGKTLLDQSIGLCAVASGLSDVDWSMHSVCGAGEGKRARVQRKLREAAGERVLDVIQSAWRWGEELIAHRDLITHFNPMAAPIMIGLESRSGTQLDYVRIRLPKDPALKKSFTADLSHEKDALDYCRETRTQLRDYLIELMNALAARRSESTA